MPVPVRPSDLTWLNMDRPTNVMVINGLFWFDTEPDFEAVRAAIGERGPGRFPLLHQRPAMVGGTWVWEDDPFFDLDRHVRHVVMPPGSDLAAAQDYLSDRVSNALDRRHPLWEFDVITGLSGEGEEPVALLLCRFHHALGDGIRVVQLIISLCDAEEGTAVTPPKVGRGPASTGLAHRAFGLSRQLVGDAVDFADHVASSAMQSAANTVTGVPQAVASTLSHLPEQVAKLRPDAHAVEQGLHAVEHRLIAVEQAVEHGVAHAIEDIEHPLDHLPDATGVTDAVTGVASEDNLLVNSVRGASRLTLSPHSPNLLGDAKPDVAKRVSWASGIDLTMVKEIGAKHGATVNDVLLAAIARGLSRYVREKGHQPPEAVNWLIPVSLKPVDGALPTDLGNHFAMVMFSMPLDGVDDDGLMHEVTSRMTRSKNSAEAMLAYAVQRAIAGTPRAVSVGITNFFANKTVGVLTNVPGPRAPVYLGGTKLSGMLGWVPTASDQWLGVCIFSYAGSVNIGITSDAGLMPDPERLAELIKEEFDIFARG